MGKKAFNKIADGLDEALSIMRGDTKPAKLFVPAELDVKAIRSHLNMPQDDFAATFGFTVSQVRDWEQGRSSPVGGLRAYLMLIESDPVSVQTMLRTASTKRAA
jgi:putative transcriptional regulator